MKKKQIPSRSYCPSNFLTRQFIINFNFPTLFNNSVCVTGNANNYDWFLSIKFNELNELVLTWPALFVCIIL